VAASPGRLSHGVVGGGQAAVHMEPPVADKDLLVEHCAVRAEEGHGVQTRVTVLQADMVDLAPLLRVSIVASHGQAQAGEPTLLDLTQYRKVQSGLARNGRSKHREVAQA